MQIRNLGDQAILAYLPDEASAVRFATAIRAANPPWLLDVVPAYASVGIYFEPNRIGLQEVCEWSRALDVPPADAVSQRFFSIPICYEMQQDITRVVEHTELTPDRIIELHVSCEYTIYAIGFVPGFPYLGYLPPEIAGVPRLPSPRVRVAPGSVGLTGRQTGIYPLPRPGGWNLIGQTPLTIVDPTDGFFPLRVGDRVRFSRIDEAEFCRLVGMRI